MPELTFTCKLNKTDYVKTMRVFYLRNKAWMVVLILLVLLAIFFSVIAWLNSIDSMFTYFFPVLAVLLFLFLFFMIPIVVGTSIEKNLLSAEATWEVNDSQVIIKNKFTSSSYDWVMFKKVYETSEHYLITYKPKEHALQIVPKRAFNSAEQEAQFRKLLEEKLERIILIRSVNLPILSKRAVIGVVMVILLLAMVVVAVINFMQRAPGR